MPSSASGRRLDRLEHGLSPRQLVTLWLEERAAFASAEDYAAWLTEQPLGQARLDGILGRPDTASGKVYGGVGRGEIPETQRDALFGVQLAMIVEGALAETVRDGSPVSAKLHWQLRALSAEWQLWLDRDDDEGLGGLVASWAAWPDALTQHLMALQVEDEARILLEHRYLDGHQAVFSATLDRLERLRGFAATMAAWWSQLPGPPIEDRSMGKDGADPTGIDLDGTAEPVRSRALARADRLADAARVATLEILGDYRGALAILENREPDGADEAPGVSDDQDPAGDRRADDRAWGLGGPRAHVSDPWATREPDA